MILVCALAAEERAARKAGAPVVRVGLGAAQPAPEGRLVSFGLAGALAGDLTPGTLVTAHRVVDAEGRTLWQAEPLPVPGSRPVVLCTAASVVDDPAERRALAARTGAEVVDMESARLAATGRLVGAVKVVSDTPVRPVGRLAQAATVAGEVDWRVVLRAFATEPVTAARAAVAARRALRRLEAAAASLADG